MKTTSQAQITLLRKLKQRKYRNLEGRFIIEGERAIRQIVQNGIVDVESVFVNPSKLDHFTGVDAKVHLMESKYFKEVSDTESPQGWLAICKIPEPKSIEEIASGSGIIVATDSIQDPGNMGTIIRSSVWYGASALLLGTGSVDVFNPKVVRSTVGATGILPYQYGEISEMLGILSENGWEILLLDGNKGAQSILDQNLTAKTVFVVGNEANGISDQLKNSDYPRILLPSKTPKLYVESLNAGVALSIALAIVHN